MAQVREMGVGIIVFRFDSKTLSIITFMADIHSKVPFTYTRFNRICGTYIGAGCTILFMALV